MNNDRLTNQLRPFQCETRFQQLHGFCDVSLLVNKKVWLATKFMCPASPPVPVHPLIRTTSDCNFSSSFDHFFQLNVVEHGMY